MVVAVVIVVVEVVVIEVLAGVVVKVTSSISRVTHSGRLNGPTTAPRRMEGKGSRYRDTLLTTDDRRVIVASVRGEAGKGREGKGVEPLITR